MTHFQDIIAAGIATLHALPSLELQLTKAAELVSTAIADGHKVLACGNGGSACDASHLVTEFVVRYIDDRRPYPAITLTESGSTLTAGGNDYGFDHVFARQVAALGQSDDVLIVFTTSGQSPNVIKALEEAKRIGLSSIAFLGRDGGAAKGMATVDLIVPSDSTARIQEAHGLLIHALCELVEGALEGGDQTIS